MIMFSDLSDEELADLIDITWFAEANLPANLVEEGEVHKRINRLRAQALWFNRQCKLEQERRAE